MALKPIQAVIYKIPQYVYQVAYSSFYRDISYFKKQLAEYSQYVSTYDLFDFKQLLRMLGLFDPVVQYFTLYYFAFQATRDSKLQYAAMAFFALYNALAKVPNAYFAPCALFANELYFYTGKSSNMQVIKSNLLALLNAQIPLERFSAYLVYFLEIFYVDYVACLKTRLEPVPLVKLLVQSPQRYQHANQLINACLPAYAIPAHRFDVLTLLTYLFEENSDVQVDYDKISVRNSSLAIRIAKYHPKIAIRMFADSDITQTCLFLQYLIYGAEIQRLFEDGCLDHLLKPMKSRFYDEVLLVLVKRLDASPSVLKKLALHLKSQTGYLGRQISDQFALQLSRLADQTLEYYEDLADDCKWDAYLVYLCQLRALDVHRSNIHSKVKLADVHAAHLNAERYKYGMPFECQSEIHAYFLIAAGFSDLQMLGRFRAARNLMLQAQFDLQAFKEEAQRVRGMDYDQLMGFVDHLIIAEEHCDQAEFSRVFKRVQQDIYSLCQRLTREQARRVWRALVAVGE